MQFFSSAIDTLQTLVVALGAGLGVWGVISIRLELYFSFVILKDDAYLYHKTDIML